MKNSTHTVIKNGTVVTSASMYRADVEIEDGKIIAIGAELDGVGKNVVDASGKLVLPGAIDAHTHMADPFGGTVSSDDELSGSRAAACGGVTTLFDFAKQHKGMHLMDAVEKKKQGYEGRSCIDYAFHCIVTDLFEDYSVLDEFQDLAEYGINSFKVYMVYRKEGLMVTDEDFIRILVRAKEVGGITTVHAESAGMVDYLTDRYQKEGKTSPWYHYMSRSEAVAAEADERVVAFAKKFRAPLYIVHMDNKEGLEAAAGAKREGYPVYIETCPQYLAFTNEVYKREDAVNYVCSPCIKGEESRQALWRGIINGEIDTVATDHCPFKREEKNWGKDDFTKIPNGCGGIEVRFPYMLSAATDGKLTYSKVVDVCCDRPAKIFGCENKGAIEIGKDADIVIYDPMKTVTLHNNEMHSLCDHTIWEGTEIHGYPVKTFLRGKLIYDDGAYIGTPGDGKFIKRKRRGYFCSL